MSDNHLTTATLEKLQHAVAEAEKETLGQIVPVVVNESDTYPDAQWRLAVICSLLSSFALYFFIREVDPIYYIYVQGPGLLLGLLLSRVPMLKRLFITPGKMTEEVRDRAYQAFLDENIHCTKEHSGLLVFVSLFERRAIIMADKGLHEKVDNKTWDAVMVKLTHHIHEDSLVLGLKECIEECGGILKTHFPRSADSVHGNELGNQIRRT